MKYVILILMVGFLAYQIYGLIKAIVLKKKAKKLLQNMPLTDIQPETKNTDNVNN